MSDDVDPAAPPARSRVRTVIATVLGVLTVLVLVVTVVAVWAKATVLRSEPVAELVGDAIAEPDVQVALSAYLADQVAASVDLDTRLIDLLPDSLDRFAVPDRCPGPTPPSSGRLDGCSPPRRCRTRSRRWSNGPTAGPCRCWRATGWPTAST